MSELVELAGGIDIFKSLSKQSLAKDRIIKNSDEVVALNPDIILASWCGKKFKPIKMLERKDWSNIKASKDKEIYELDSAIILQPGPASVSEGLEQMHQIFKKWAEKNQQ